MLISEVHPTDTTSAPQRLGDNVIYRPTLYRPIIRPEPEDGNGPTFLTEGYLYATCETAVDEGLAVYAKGAANHVAVASAAYPFPVIGICVKKTAINQCIVQRFGTVRHLFKDILPQARYLLGIDGALIVPPIEDDRIEFAQQVATGLSSTEIMLQPTGLVIKIHVDKEQGTANVGQGEPHIQQVYPPENIYVAQDTGDWYTMPAGTDDLTHFFVGIGPPSDAVTYAPRAVYVDELTGAYYVQGEMGNEYVPISSGRGDPNVDPPTKYKVIYLNQETGEAYYG